MGRGRPPQLQARGLMRLTSPMHSGKIPKSRHGEAGFCTARLGIRRLVFGGEIHRVRPGSSGWRHGLPGPRLALLGLITWLKIRLSDDMSTLGLTRRGGVGPKGKPALDPRPGWGWSRTFFFIFLRISMTPRSRPRANRRAAEGANLRTGELSAVRDFACSPITTTTKPGPSSEQRKPHSTVDGRRSTIGW